MTDVHTACSEIRGSELCAFHLWLHHAVLLVTLVFWSNQFPAPLTIKFNIKTACPTKTLPTTKKRQHRIARVIDKIHSRYILKLTVQESPVQKPYHAQIQPLQSYLFVIVLLIKLHYSMVLYFLPSWSFITIFRLAPTSVSTLHLPNNTNTHSHISPTFEALQILSVPVHIHGALR